MARPTRKIIQPIPLNIEQMTRAMIQKPTQKTILLSIRIIKIRKINSNY